eukprot:280471-Ditylum_brightwellii.AAC.1
MEFDVPYPQGRIQYFWIAKIKLMENLAVGPLGWTGEIFDRHRRIQKRRHWKTQCLQINLG